VTPTTEDTGRRVPSARPPRLDGLHQRLRAVVETVLPGGASASGDLPEQTGAFLDALVRRALVTGASKDAWILYVAACGQFPEPTELAELRARLELSDTPADAAAHVLRAAAQAAGAPRCARPIHVVTGTVVVDVDHAARKNRHTGIQRVTRETCSRWSTDRDITLVAWNDEETALRALAEHEKARVLDWRGGHEATAEEMAASDAAPMVVPWECTVVLPEVAQGMTARTLACLAESSGNAVVAVGYDAIPVTSADLRPPGEPNMYVRYLNVIKHTRRVAAISSSAAAEFAGFSAAVRAQGVRGPDVVEIPLATRPAPGPAGLPPADRSGRPRALCVGSHEVHKNHLAVLHAAELCWRDGLDFELVFIGGPGWASPELDPRLRALVAQGRPVTALGNVTDDELWRAYRGATFSIFPSIHEGFGLPVAESLACGAPVITTAYGSTRDIAEHGGCLLVDPRDDHAIAGAIRTMLTDASTYARLADEAGRFPLRTWDEYAHDLWQALVEPDRTRA